MRIIKHRQWLEDSWTRLPADTPLPPSGDYLLELERWNELSPTPDRGGRCGLWLGPDDHPAEIQRLERLELIAIEFPSFMDGRGYSLARLLRQRYGYTRELRAVGEILRDQLLYLARVGFDSFCVQVPEGTEASVVEAFDELPAAYQATWTDPQPLFRRVRRPGDV